MIVVHPFNHTIKIREPSSLLGIQSGHNEFEGLWDPLLWESH